MSKTSRPNSISHIDTFYRLLDDLIMQRGNPCKKIEELEIMIEEMKRHQEKKTIDIPDSEYVRAKQLFDYLEKFSEAGLLQDFLDFINEKD